MSKVNESSEIYEGQYFKAFVNDRKMLEIQTVSNDSFICMVTLSENGGWAEHYIDKMQDELDEIAEMFIDSTKQYDGMKMLFGQDIQESLDKLTIRKK